MKFTSLVITLRFKAKRRFSNGAHFVKPIAFPSPEFDVNYLCNPKNYESIASNILKRKGVGDISLVQELYKTMQIDSAVQELFLAEAHKIPNQTHPAVYNLGEEPRVIKYIGEKRLNTQKYEEFANIAKKLNLIRTDHLGNLTGHRSYFLHGELAELEQALLKYTVDGLKAKGFQLVSVPDVLPGDMIERCGMNIHGERTQVQATLAFC